MSDSPYSRGWRPLARRLHARPNLLRIYLHLIGKQPAPDTRQKHPRQLDIKNSQSRNMHMVGTARRHRRLHQLHIRRPRTQRYPAIILKAPSAPARRHPPPLPLHPIAALLEGAYPSLNFVSVTLFPCGLKTTLLIYARINKIPRPQQRSRFSSSVGLGNSAGLNPGP